MPVSVLLVEGKLDAEVLAPVIMTMAAHPTVVPAGSKNSLAPKAKDRRKERTPIVAAYLRDRDFDFDPPLDLTQPTIDRKDPDAVGGMSVLGWRWCRHEIESYLLDPRVMAAAGACSEAAAAEGLLAAARGLCHYSAARWAIGIARRDLPPMHEFPTRPQGLGDLAVPEDRSQQQCSAWALRQTGDFLKKVDETLGDAVVGAVLDERTRRLAALTTAEDVLVWHAGKDLFAALSPDIYRGFAADPYALRDRLRRWVIRRPGDMLALFAEWRNLVSFL